MEVMMPNKSNDAPFAYDGLDRIFHEKARLSILTSLVGQADGLPFAQLKQLCGLTDGNLSRHLQILQDAGLVSIHKGYEGNRPHTTCQLTENGRAKFADYLSVLEQVIKNALPDAHDNHAMLEELTLKPT
jgi:DNA-binding MarR family transcriptional regulator